MTFKKLSKRVFRKSSSLTNRSLTCASVFSLSAGAFGGVYGATGLLWASYVGATCWIWATASMVVAFSAQSVSQFIRLLAKLSAKITGQEPPVFREELPLYAKVIRKAFRTTKDKGVNLFHTLKARSLSKVTQVTQRKVYIRAGRTYRSASRPAFVQASGGDDSGGGSESGDSNPGEPPSSSSSSSLSLRHNLSFINPLCKQIVFCPPWRFLYVLGRWCMALNPLSVGRGE